MLLIRVAVPVAKVVTCCVLAAAIVILLQVASDGVDVAAAEFFFLNIQPNISNTIKHTHIPATTDTTCFLMQFNAFYHISNHLFKQFAIVVVVVASC